MKSFLSSKISIFLIFTIIACLAYWQVAFLYNSLKWDMLDCYIPWRGFVADCISDRIFPFWCPYQKFGYPIHADICSVLSPEYWFSGILLGGYSVYTMHCFFIFYVIVAGYGMHRLTTYLGCNNTASFISGVVYMLSGYMVSQGQEIGSLAGLAWIPFALLFYLKMTNSGSYTDILKTSVFLFLTINGAYPAITIILNYLFLTIFVISIIRAVVIKDYKKSRQLLLCNILLYGLILLMGLFYIISLHQSIKYIARFSGLNANSVMTYPFTPQSLLSLIFPFATVTKIPDFFKTDLTMNNLYIGLFFLLFFIISFFRKKSLFEKNLLIFGFISLLASFGPYTPVRAWMQALPLMNMFQYPSFFRPFVIISIIILAAGTLSDFFNNPDQWKNKLLKASYILTGFIVIALFFSIFHLKKGSLPFINSIYNSDIYGHIFLQGLLQLCVIVSFIFILKLYNRIKYAALFLVILITADMFLSVQLNAYYTVVHPIDASTLNTYLKKQPHSFPIPELTPLERNSDQSVVYYPFWINTNTISQQISFDGFNPFNINNRAYLKDSIPYLYDKVLKNPPLYFSAELYPLDSLKNRESICSEKALFLSASDYNKLHVLKLRNNNKDKIYPLSFSPNNIKAKVQCADSSMITYLQTFYPGWKYFVDGKEQTIYNTNINFLSGVVPAGTHVIEFRYSNNSVFFCFVLTYIVFILILLVLLYSFSGNYFKKSTTLYFTGTVFLIFILYMLYFLSKKTISNSASLEDSLLTKNIKEFENTYGSDNMSIALNCDRPDLCDSVKTVDKSAEIIFFRINKYSKLADFKEFTDTLKRKYLLYFINRISEFNGIEEIILEEFPSKIYERKFKDGRFCLYSKDKREIKKPQISVYQDFSGNKDHWNIPDNLGYDTLQKFQGKKTLLLDSIRPYSPALVCKTSQLQIHKKIKRVVLKTDFMVSSLHNTSFLVLKFQKPLCEKRDWYFPLHEFARNENKWTHAVFELELDLGHSIWKDLEIFAWNQGGNKMLVANVQVDFY